MCCFSCVLFSLRTFATLRLCVKKSKVCRSPPGEKRSRENILKAHGLRSVRSKAGLDHNNFDRQEFVDQKPRRGLVSAAAAEDAQRRAEQHLYITHQALILYIRNIERYLLLEIEFGPAANLPEAS